MKCCLVPLAIIYTSVLVIYLLPNYMLMSLVKHLNSLLCPPRFAGQFLSALATNWHRVTVVGKAHLEHH